MTLSKESRAFLESATSQYQEHLDDAADWLRGRGIDLEHARSEGLGVVRNPSALHQEYEGRLAIPYLTDCGPVNMSFRCLQDHVCREAKYTGSDGKEYACPKYKKSVKAESDLYGVQSFDDATDWIAVCEGELDSLILRQIGIPAISNPGATNWNDWWPNIFEDLSRIYIFADGDAAGDKMFKMFRDRLKVPCVKVLLPKGEDVNSTFLKYGADAILSRVKK